MIFFTNSNYPNLTGKTNGASTNLGLRKPSFIAKPVHSTKKFPLVEVQETEVITRTVFTEHNTERRVSQSTFEASGIASGSRMVNSQSVGSDLNQKDATRIPIYFSGSGSKVTARSNPNLTSVRPDQEAVDNHNNKEQGDDNCATIDAIQRCKFAKYLYSKSIFKYSFFDVFPFVFLNFFEKASLFVFRFPYWKKAILNTNTFYFKKLSLYEVWMSLNYYRLSSFIRPLFFRLSYHCPGIKKK